MGKVSSCKDLLMLLLYAKGHKGEQCEPIVGKTRLMKMVFLFDKEIRRKFNLEQSIPDEVMPYFEARNFGPFSGQIYQDLEFLVEMGLVDVVEVGKEELIKDEIEEYSYWQATSDVVDRPFPEEFWLTPLGRQFVEEKLKDELSEENWKTLDEFKKRCTSAPLKALLKYVYSKYPETTKESTIRDEVLGQ